MKVCDKMITPSSDKQKIKEILEKDDFIKKAGVLPENIKTTKATSEIFTSNDIELKIFISSGLPSGKGNDIVKNSTYRIHVTGSREKSTRIDKIAEQIMALLDGEFIGNGHVLYLLDPPLEMESVPDIYVTEVTFLCQGTTFHRLNK